MITQTQEEISTILKQLTVPQTRNKALEQFTLLLINKSPQIILQILSEEFENANINNKEIPVLLPLFFASSQNIQISILKEVLALLRKSIIIANSTIFEFIAKIFGQIVNLFCHNNHNEEIQSNAHTILYAFCLDTINLPNSDIQREGFALLIELIENSFIVKDVSYIKSIWKIISVFLDDKDFKHKAYSIKCLVSLIFSAEEAFQPYANNALYKVLDFLPDSDWVKRKHSLNVVYTLGTYCLEQITPLMDDIIEFLNVLKNDKVAEVQEICIQTLRLFQESMKHPKMIKRPKSIEPGNKLKSSAESNYNSNSININITTNAMPVSSQEPQTSKVTKRRNNLSFNIDQSKVRFANSSLYNTHNSSNQPHGNDINVAQIKKSILNQHYQKDMTEERPMTPVTPTSLTKVLFKTPLESQKQHDLSSKSKVHKSVEFNSDSRNKGGQCSSQTRPKLQTIINEEPFYTERNVNYTKPRHNEITPRKEQRKRANISLKEASKIIVNKGSTSIIPSSNIVISEYSNKRKNYSSIDRINIINNINNNPKPNDSKQNSMQHSSIAKPSQAPLPHEILLNELTAQIKLMNEKQNSLMDTLEKIESNSKKNYISLDSRISSLETSFKSMISFHSKANTLKQVEALLTANDFTLAIPMMCENSTTFTKALLLIKKKQIAKISQQLIEMLLAKVIEVIPLGEGIDVVLEFILRVLNEKISLKKATKKKIKESMEFLMNNKHSMSLDEHCYVSIRSIISHSFNK